jgi:hypothetical protein
MGGAADHGSEMHEFAPCKNFGAAGTLEPSAVLSVLPGGPYLPGCRFQGPSAWMCVRACRENGSQKTRRQRRE